MYDTRKPVRINNDGQVSCGRWRWKASDIMMHVSSNEYAHSMSVWVTIVRCASIRQCNLTPTHKVGCLQCTGFIETGPLTSNEAIVQSNQCWFISCQLQLHIIVCRLCSWLIHYVTNLDWIVAVGIWGRLTSSSFVACNSKIA